MSSSRNTPAACERIILINFTAFHVIKIIVKARLLIISMRPLTLSEAGVFLEALI